MKLAISNIAWDQKNDKEIYCYMRQLGIEGLEIAPTRVFPDNPYERLEEAKIWKRDLALNYGFEIPSMQSIWYGRQEKLFGNNEERQILIDYTKKAIDFAEAIGCKNLVFGCPKNRNVSDGQNSLQAVPFFKEIGDYAYLHHTVIGMEANPTIYNTNYINDTVAAIDLIKQINSKGFLLNLDLGTMIQNKEEIKELEGNVSLINHVHISEPGLKPIEERILHKELYNLLSSETYNGFISIEMGKVDNVNVLKTKIEYVRSIFR